MNVRKVRYEYAVFGLALLNCGSGARKTSGRRPHPTKLTADLVDDRIAL